MSSHLTDLATSANSWRPSGKQGSIFLPNLCAGGAERVNVNLANGLAARGYQIDVVVLNAEGALLDELQPQIRIVNLEAPRMRNALLPLVGYLRESRPAAMLACMWPLTVIAVLAKWMAHSTTRLFVVEHTTWSHSELLTSRRLAWQIRASMHYLFPKADGVLAVSNGAADDLARFAKLKRGVVRTIYNPVVGEPRTSSPQQREPRSWWDGSHKRVLAVGTLKAIKDYGTLLDAFALLQRQVNARLLILGEGECRDRLVEQVRSLGLDEKVFMPGFVVDTAPYYERTDLHVLSSAAEGLPTVIIEALASGKPVVSTDCPSGPREILADGQFGRLVPVGDVKALASAMAEALSITHDTAALKNRAQDFSIDKAVDQYEAMLFPKQSEKV